MFLSTTALAVTVATAAAARAEAIWLAKTGWGGDLCSDCVSSRDAKDSSRSYSHFVLLRINKKYTFLVFLFFQNVGRIINLRN